MVLTECTNYIN